MGVWVLENVVGILGHSNGATWRRVLGEIHGIPGYELHWSKVKTKNHGVPQNQQRVYIAGLRSNTLNKDMLWMLRTCWMSRSTFRNAF